MNKQDRKELDRAIELLNGAKEIIDTIKDSEQDKFDNLPEGLQASEKGERFENAVSVLEQAVDNIDEAIESIQEAQE